MKPFAPAPLAQQKVAYRRRLRDQYRWARHSARAYHYTQICRADGLAADASRLTANIDANEDMAANRADRLWPKWREASKPVRTRALKYIIDSSAAVRAKRQVYLDRVAALLTPYEKALRRLATLHKRCLASAS